MRRDRLQGLDDESTCGSSLVLDAVLLIHRRMKCLSLGNVPNLYTENEMRIGFMDDNIQNQTLVLERLLVCLGA